MRKILNSTLLVLILAVLLTGCLGNGNTQNIEPYQNVSNILNARGLQTSAAFHFASKDCNGGFTTPISTSSQERVCVTSKSDNYLIIGNHEVSIGTYSQGDYITRQQSGNPFLFFTPKNKYAINVARNIRIGDYVYLLSTEHKLWICDFNECNQAQGQYNDMLGIDAYNTSSACGSDNSCGQDMLNYASILTLASPTCVKNGSNYKCSSQLAQIFVNSNPQGSQQGCPI